VKAYCDFFSALVQVRTAFGSYPIKPLPRQSFYVGIARNQQYSSATNFLSNKRAKAGRAGPDACSAVTVALILKIVFAGLSAINDIIRQRKKGALQFEEIYCDTLPQ
jgi:hypothetical protein